MAKDNFYKEYSAKQHKSAIRKVKELIVDGYEDITLYDGSGWQVTFLPAKNKYCTPTGCESLDRGMRYLEMGAGMVESWKWRVSAHREEVDREKIRRELEQIMDEAGAIKITDLGLG